MYFKRRRKCGSVSLASPDRLYSLWVQYLLPEPEPEQEVLNSKCLSWKWGEKTLGNKMTPVCPK